MSDDEAIMVHDTSITRVGGSIMLTLPSVIIASLEATTKQPLSQSDRYFSAKVSATKDGRLIVSEIREREKIDKTVKRKR
jgi:hypothetical protein